MGTINNNAVIASTEMKDEVERIRKYIDGLKAFEKSLFLFSDEAINGKVTVVMVPDGSKEGWSESDVGDESRAAFIKELEKTNYKDGSSSWQFIEVGFGDYGQKILRGNCKNAFSDSEYAIDDDPVKLSSKNETAP